MRTRTHLNIIIILALSFASCHHTNTADGVKITFTSAMENEQKLTKADGGSEPLNDDFWAWSYKTVNSVPSAVIEGYHISYVQGTAGTSEDNTHDYLYVGNTSLKNIDQTIKFWDYGASEYNFWGATINTTDPNDPNDSFNSDGTTLAISGLTQSVTEPSWNVIKHKLFSKLYHRSPVSSDVVRLEFLRPYSKVRILFFTNAEFTTASFDDIQIKNITFGPESSNPEKKIITAGTLEVTYPTSGVGPESYETTSTSSVASWSFNGVTLDHDHGTSSDHAVIGVPAGGVEFYYALPKNYATPFVLSATIDNESKTAVVPAAYMNWLPNTVYTYIFKISGGNRIELYDVTIDPWQFGGSQDEEWKNW